MRRFVFLTMVALVMAGALASPAWAATFTVDRIDDPDLSTTPTADDCTDTANDCSLRGAITAANATAGDDTIDIGVSGEVNLTAALPDLSTNIEIVGPGSDQFTVRRDTGGDYTIFTVTGDTTVVTIKGMTISNGDFGGIENRATLTVTDSTISGNTLDSQGGGIGNYGDLTVTDSTISGNSSSAGGGILNAGTATVTGSTISGNTAKESGGGGIWSEGVGLTITDSTISGNSTDATGGGILNYNPATITDSTISGNTAGSADGSPGQGGGIWAQTDPGGATTIRNSTISGNTATGEDAIGGGVFNADRRTVIEFSTITNNTAPDGAGSGVASACDTETSTEVLSSIISANTNTDVDSVNNSDGCIVPTDINSFVSNGYNLIGDGNATGAFNQTTDLPPGSDPLLDPLDSYGGPTQTHRLQSDSPAIDAGPPTNGNPIACPPPPTDQRGVSRQQGSACDIGAYEVEVDVEDTTAPTVTAVAPDGTGPVSRTANVTATFSEPVQNVSPSTFFLERQIAAKVKKDPPKYVLVDATATPSADGISAVLDPVQDLPKGDYRATITTDVKDLADNKLDQDKDPTNGNQPKVWFFMVKK